MNRLCFLANCLSALPAGRVGLLLFTLSLLVGLSGCSPKSQSNKGTRMRLAVGEIKEVTIDRLGGNVSITGTSDNQEVVDVSQRAFTAADSSALKQGNAVPTVFLIKGVTIGTARVVLSEKTADQTKDSWVRRAYVVQVVSK